MQAEFRPLFDQSQISYQREEKDGHISVLFDETPELNTQLLNPTMKLIIDLCDGVNSMEHIQSKMKKLFPEVSAETIENDVMKALVLMDRYALLKWDPESPFVPENKRVRASFPAGFTVTRAMEDDIKKVIHLIDACELVEVALDCNAKPRKRRKAWFADSMMSNPAMFHPVILRRRIFNFQETFWIVEKDGETLGCLSLITEFPVKKCSHVNLILFRDGVEPADYLPALLDTAFANLEKDEVKLKMALNSAARNFDEITALLRGSGFVEEARLKDEYDIGVSECIYARHVCGE